MNDQILRHAEWYLSLGISIIPLHGKIPNASVLPRSWNPDYERLEPQWEEFQQRHCSREELYKWVQHEKTTGIGIVGGTVSGGLHMIDFDSMDILKAWSDGFNADQLRSHGWVRSHRGAHVYLWTDQIISSRVLAMGEGRHELIGLRSEGKYCAAPPSLHPSGTSYAWQTPMNTDLIPIELLQSYLTHARTFTKTQQPDPDRMVRRGSSYQMTPYEFRLMQDYNKRTELADILIMHGYTPRGRGFVRPDGSHPSVYIITDKHGNSRSFHHNVADPAYSNERRSWTAFDWLVHDMGTLQDALVRAAQELQRPYTPKKTTLNSPNQTEAEEIELIPSRGTPIIPHTVLTDNRDVAGALASMRVNAVYGMHGSWPRVVLRKIIAAYGDGPKAVYWARLDGYAEYTAKNLDATVVATDPLPPEYLQRADPEDVLEAIVHGRNPQ